MSDSEIPVNRVNGDSGTETKLPATMPVGVKETNSGVWRYISMNKCNGHVFLQATVYMRLDVNNVHSLQRRAH